MPDNETRSIEVKSTDKAGISDLAYFAQWKDEHLRAHEDRKEALDRSIQEAIARVMDSMTALETHLQVYEEYHKRVHELEDKAVQLDKVNTDKRLEGVNEFRAQLIDQAQTFSRTDLVNAGFKALEGKIDTLSNSVGERLTALEKFQNSQQGRSGGSAATIAYIISAISVASMIVTFIVLLTR